MTGEAPGPASPADTSGGGGSLFGDMSSGGLFAGASTNTRMDASTCASCTNHQTLAGILPETTPPEEKITVYLLVAEEGPIQLEVSLPDDIHQVKAIPLPLPLYPYPYPYLFPYFCDCAVVVLLKVSPTPVSLPPSRPPSTPIQSADVYRIVSHLYSRVKYSIMC